MKRTEVLEFLKDISAVVPNFDHDDERKINMWHRLIGKRMTLEEARRYLVEHFEQSRFAPMPVDIITRARAAFDPDSIVPLEPPADMKGEFLDGN